MGGSRGGIVGTGAARAAHGRLGGAGAGRARARSATTIIRPMLDTRSLRHFEPTGDEERDVREMTRRIMASLERTVAAAPGAVVHLPPRLAGAGGVTRRPASSELEQYRRWNEARPHPDDAHGQPAAHGEALYSMMVTLSRGEAVVEAVLEREVEDRTARRGASASSKRASTSATTASRAARASSRTCSTG